MDGSQTCNTSMIVNTQKMEAVIFDPGCDSQRYIDKCYALKVALKACFLTHAHPDHALSCGGLKETLGVPVYLCKKDELLWKDMEPLCMDHNTPYFPSPDYWLSDGMTLPYCGGTVIHTPGHSAGSVSYFFEEESFILTGDTLLCGCTGRTDLRGGDPDALQQSLDKLRDLPSDITVIPGHGSNTTIGNELY